MKKNLILGWLLCLAPVWVGAQVVDTTAVVREVDSLRQAAIGFYNAGEFEKGLPVIIMAAETAKAKLGNNHLKYAEAINTVGSFYFQLGQYDQVEPYWLEAKGIREKALGKEHPDYATSLNNLAALYMDMGNYEKAEPLCLESKAIREKALGKEHPEYARTLGNLAALYMYMGNYEKAEPLYLESKAIREKAQGKEHPDYAASLNNLAGLYLHMGNYEKAEPLYLESKAIREKAQGKEHPDYATSLDNLATLYTDMGNYEKAEPLLLESKAIREKAFGKENPHYAETLNLLANLYRAMGNYERAEPLHLEAKAIRKKTLGKEHPDYVATLNNLASLYHDMGNYEKAEPLFLECKTFEEKAVGKEHPSYGASLNNLASLYLSMGDYKKAEPLFLESKAIWGKAFGKESFNYTVSLSNLTALYENQNKYSESEPLLSELYSIEQARLSKSISFLSEGELANYTATFQESGDNLGSYLLARSPRGQVRTLPALAFGHALFHKGFLLTAAVRLNALAAASPESEEINLRLKGCRRRLAAQYAEPIAERKGVAELEEKAGAAEKELARSVAGYAEAIRQVNWQEVRVVLKKDEAAVEFVHFRVNFPKATDSTMYAALVLRPGDTQPQFIPLFEEKALAPLLRGAAGGSNFLKINALYAAKTAGSKPKSLYELIWQPLESLLAGTKTVYCSPSGLLHRINLAAIPTSDGKAFGDSRQLVLLGSTRQLVVPPIVIPSGNSAYLVGGIRYDTDSTAIAYANRSTSGSRSIEQPSVLAFQPDSLSATRGGVLDYLPATAAEVREIGQTLAAAGIRAKVDTGFYATEEAFRQLGVGSPSPRIVHFATHGYFFPDPVSKGQKANSNFGQEPVFKMSEHPMIRSGLIMASAKQAWLTGKHPQGQEDGILTAYEISQMNLSGTEFVVLSACETGLGDIMGNEGVYGLQRAFKIAGAKYLIMSLWKVDDRSTQEFMTGFYRHWLTDKQPVPQAFRTAQREVRAKHPGAYDWAGFVLIE